MLGQGPTRGKVGQEKEIDERKRDLGNGRPIESGNMACSIDTLRSDIC